MVKNYMKDFLKEIMKKHFIIGLLSVVVILFLYFYLDYFYNGVSIDIIQDFFGWRIAHFILLNKDLVIFIVILIALIINVLLVEIYAIKKIAKVFSSMKMLFQKDSQQIVLENSLKELENDLNELKKANIENEKKVIYETQHKVDMIAYLAHDIRTPLSSIIGYLCLINENDLSNDIKDKCINMTLDKAYRLEKLVDEFFEIAKLNQTSVTLNKERINLSYFLNQMKEEFYPLLKNKNQKIAVFVDEDISINVDAKKMARVFNNIIKNAMYYGLQNSTISIKAILDEHFIHIYFENNGDKIPEDKLEHIFEEFYRLDESRSSYTGGSGLGLSIAKTIVSLHDGTISASSTNERTIFRVILPNKDY